jgi:phosphoglucosamine mutase
VVISASHNPYRDNGIKFFGADGFKLDDRTELEIEAALDLPVTPCHPGPVRAFAGAPEDYLAALQERFAGLDLTGRRVLLDCANGATYWAAPEIFRRLGADVDVIAADPDGRNINHDCGSTHLDRLKAAMQAGDHDTGFAFDGDGDRVIAVDAEGEIRDGDELVALCAIRLAGEGSLDGGVAVTVMSNYGFHRAMADAGIEVATTPVGDRHVAAALSERGWSLGGEQSGHIIWSEYGPTGDGIAAALLVMRALDGDDLADAIPIRKLPQMLQNVEIADRDALAGASGVWQAVERENAGLEGRGRVLVRPSGTEPTVRVMVEAPTEEECAEVCERLVAVVQQELS